MKTSHFDYELPPDLIAQEPLPERGQSRMMVVHRESGSIDHRHIADLPETLRAGDLLVVNDTKVIPVRIFGSRIPSGGKVELLLLEEKNIERRTSNAEHRSEWEAMFRASRPAKRGVRLTLANGSLDGEILETVPEGRVTVRLTGERPVMDVLEAEGVPPVPPYIKRSGAADPRVTLDRERYQTVYASVPGAVAAPTAGLHFTPSLLADLEECGVRRAAVTLHVGPGTFKPVKTDEVEEHDMEAERYAISRDTADLIDDTRAAGGRIVAVGSTAVRTLETAAAQGEAIHSGDGRTSLFIYPPYRFACVDCLLTNFHLPRSTLIMMVSAFAGRELVLEAYRCAVEERYRFYSYGDSMLIL